LFATVAVTLGVFFVV